MQLRPTTANVGQGGPAADAIRELKRAACGAILAFWCRPSDR
jgi:hypothetical protein